MSVRRLANGDPQPLVDAIPDGDTTGVHLEGSGSVRFLGIDSPEKSIDLPLVGGSDLRSPQWETYLTDPFQAQFGPFALEEPLLNHLRSRIGPGAGANHRSHAEKAKQALTALVEADMAALGQDLNTFKYFIAFEFEVFDSHGRFLAFVNREQPNANNPAPRPLTYNSRMLESGAALPYFIWPNVDPFRQASSLLEAVLPPGDAKAYADKAPRLKEARDFVRQARANGNGVFGPADPLRFEPFEIRYLGRRKPPDRAVINLSSDDDLILRPQSYFEVPNAEDRLFVPMPFVPLFVSRGWRLEGWF